jgi:hypothetical protein
MGEERIALGFVIGPTTPRRVVLTPHVLQQFKTHPLVRGLDGGERIGWGAKDDPRRGCFVAGPLSVPGAIDRRCGRFCQRAR